MEAEIEMMQLQAKKFQRLLELKEGRKDFFPRAFRGGMALLMP